MITTKCPWYVVLAAGFEPAIHNRQPGLSRLCIPFHHASIYLESLAVLHPPFHADEPCHTVGSCPYVIQESPTYSEQIISVPARRTPSHLTSANELESNQPCGGAGWTRTTDVSRVTALQAATLAAGLLPHIYFWCAAEDSNL